MTTIKEHLDAIRNALEHYRNDEIDKGDTPYEANDALQRIDDITSILDAPMKSAEDWRSMYWKKFWPNDEDITDFIRAIQQDARISQQQIETQTKDTTK